MLVPRLRVLDGRADPSVIIGDAERLPLNGFILDVIGGKLVMRVDLKARVE